MRLLAMTPKARPARAVMVAVVAVVVVVVAVVSPRVATRKALQAKRVRPPSRPRPKVALPPTKSRHPVASVSVSPVASVSLVVRLKKQPCRLHRPLA